MKFKAQVITFLLLGFWSLLLGLGAAFALDNGTLKSTDLVPSRYQLGYESYLETCSGCHLPIPPAVLPIESWKRLLEQPDKHYGTSLTGFNRLTQRLMWDYLSTFSRPLSINEPLPLYVEQSRYFKALHPRVDLPKPTSSKTCLVCHPKAEQFDYRTLTPEWENAP